MRPRSLQQLCFQLGSPKLLLSLRSTLLRFGAQDEGVEPPIDRRDTWGSEPDSPDDASDQSPESEDPDDGT